jgi:hypothetical protein
LVFYSSAITMMHGPVYIRLSTYVFFCCIPVMTVCVFMNTACTMVMWKNVYIENKWHNDIVFEQ